MKYPAVILYLKTKDNGEELRYTLRTLKNIKNWNGEVFIIGDKEDWYTPKVKLIETKRKFGKKHADQRARLRTAIDSPDIAETFIYMNDDFYINKPVEVNAFHAGEIQRDYGFSKSNWLKTKYRTRQWLKGKGVPEPLDYDVHMPMLFNKSKLKTVLDECDKQHPDFEIQFRSIYGNIHNIGGKKIQDGKHDPNATISSTKDANQLLSFELTHEPSEFEKCERIYTTTILMALYNTEDYVRRALDSIPKRINEIIVCDDGSKDNSRTVVKQWIADNPDRNAKLLFNKTNKGVGYTKNKLIDNATQDYFTFLDSDDYFYTDVNKVINALDGSDIVFYDLHRTDGKRYRLNDRTKFTHPGEVKFWRREFVGDTRNDNERHAEDEVLFHKLQKKNPTEKYTNVIAKHYEYPREGSIRYNYLNAKNKKTT